MSDFPMQTMEQGDNPYVVSAAMRFDYGNHKNVIVMSPRHYDVTCLNTLYYMGFLNDDERRKNEVQGFVDQWGNFMTREEAREIACNNGQFMRNSTALDNILFSEDLY